MCMTFDLLGVASISNFHHFIGKKVIFTNWHNEVHMLFYYATAASPLLRSSRKKEKKNLF